MYIQDVFIVFRFFKSSSVSNKVAKIRGTIKEDNDNWCLPLWGMGFHKFSLDIGAKREHVHCHCNWQHIQQHSEPRHFSVSLPLFYHCGPK